MSYIDVAVGAIRIWGSLILFALMILSCLFVYWDKLRKLKPEFFLTVMRCRYHQKPTGLALQGTFSLVDHVDCYVNIVEI